VRSHWLYFFISSLVPFCFWCCDGEVAAAEPAVGRVLFLEFACLMVGVVVFACFRKVKREVALAVCWVT
jgi:hypothetical protein